MLGCRLTFNGYLQYVPEPLDLVIQLKFHGANVSAALCHLIEKGGCTLAESVMYSTW